jgi:hypothetical protein
MGSCVSIQPCCGVLPKVAKMQGVPMEKLQKLQKFHVSQMKLK